MATSEINSHATCDDYLQQQSTNDVLCSLYWCVWAVEALCSEFEAGITVFSAAEYALGGFINLLEKADVWLRKGHLDGPLDDLISNEIDGVVAKLLKCAQAHRFHRGGRGEFDPYEFRVLYQALQKHRRCLKVSLLFMHMLGLIHLC